MKLDLDYIKKLLNIMNECEEDQVQLRYLFSQLKKVYPITDNLTEDLLEKKLRNHLYILFEAGYIQSSTMDLGFKTCLSGEVICNSSARYWFTMDGYKLLESINNDTLFNKLKSGISYLGIETLKQIPAITIELIKDELMKRIGL